MSGKISREKHFIKSIVILAFGTFLPKMGSFVTLPIYTAVLTKSEYGTYDLITILCSLLLPSATLQIQTAAFRFLLDDRGDEKRVRTIITTVACFITPISIIVLSILYYGLNTLSPMLRVLIICYFFVDIILSAIKQVARGMSLNDKYSISVIINSFLNMALVVVCLLVFRFGMNGLLLSLTISEVTSLFYLVFSMKLWRYLDISSLDKKYFIQMMQYAWPMVPNTMSMWVLRVSDRALILLFLGVEANAVYAVANKIPTLLQILQNTFSMAWTESASLTVNDIDVEDYYSRMFRTIHRVLIGSSAMLMACLPILFSLLIRGSYDEAYVQIPILIIGMFFSSIALYLGGIYAANKRTMSVGITTVVAAALNFIINIMFIKQIGIFAASFSTAICFLVLMVYRMKNVLKFQKINYAIGEIIICDLILVGMAFICTIRSLPAIIANFVIGVIVFVVFNRDIIVQMVLISKNKIHSRQR